jgi:hypothetical protein
MFVASLQVSQKTNKKNNNTIFFEKNWFWNDDDVNPLNFITRKTLKQRRSGDLT